jgi:hypothetical protein
MNENEYMVVDFHEGRPVFTSPVMTKEECEKLKADLGDNAKVVPADEGSKLRDKMLLG